jgi:hypothetical protein
MKSNVGTDIMFGITELLIVIHNLYVFSTYIVHTITSILVKIFVISSPQNETQRSCKF